MITAEGAGVIATIIPIGLLIVGFEIQRVPKMVATGRSGTLGLWLLGAVFMLAVLMGFFAEWLLLESVAAWSEVEGPRATMVWVALWFIGLASLILLLASLADALGILDRLANRAMRRAARSPRRHFRQLSHAEEHHRGPGPTDDA